MTKIILFIGTIFLWMGFQPGGISAATEPAQSPQDAHGTRGWWWYEDPKKEEKKEAKEDEKPKRVLPSIKDYTADQLWNMHPDDFQPLTLSFLKKAVQAPTLETLREFYTMVDIARAKAHVFQNVAAAVWQKYPELSLGADIPVNTEGRITKDQLTIKEREEKISSSADQFALIYFYRTNCQFCKTQDAVLAGFVEKYQRLYQATWEIKRVEIDEHPDLAARFDVKITPYLMLIYRDSKDYFPVTIGVSDRGELEDRIYRGIRLLNGEITPESYTMYEFQRGGKLDPTGYMRSEEQGKDQ